MLWIMFFADGEQDLIDVAERCSAPVRDAVARKPKQSGSHSPGRAGAPGPILVEAPNWITAMISMAVDVGVSRSA
jgi:hypothetical protein